MKLNLYFTVRRGALALMLALAGNSLTAQPSGGQVVAGDASFSTGLGGLTITQTSGRAIINWQDFSIAAGDFARFIQPDAASATLNRVVSGLPSSVLGSLEANGRVFLINPNGVLIGAGARIDTAGFLASTLDVTNQDFLAGGDLHFAGDSTAAVQNLGAINALGGDVFLIARRVENTGTISAAGGSVGLAAGSEVLLTTGGSERVFVQAGSAPGTLANAGTITAATAELKAAGGNTYALAINNSGTVRATGSAVRNGQVWLVASGESAVVTSGTLDASGRNPGETGGSIKVLGQYVGLSGAAKLDASGDAGGGTILVGGDFQGNNPDVRNAYRTYVGSDVTINADAINSGNGGRGIVWANDTTRFYGAISTRGGAQGGDGGFVETSGKVNLQAFGSVDASAPNGAAGQWLLDPNNITIQSAGSDTNVSATPNFTSSADSAIVTTGSIEAALNGGTSVVITTGSGGAQLGNITVASNISKTLGADATLALLAHNNIIVNGGISISSTSNKLDVTLNADRDASGVGNIQMNSASSITTNGGNITLGGGATPLTTPAVGSGTGTLADKAGIYLNNAALSAGAGNISLRGTGRALTFSTYGIYSLGGTVIQTTSGTISLFGTGGTGAGANNNYGVYLTGGGTSIQSANGAVSITGTGGGAGSGSGYNGIYLEGGAKVISTGAATITLNGLGGGATNSNHGVVLVDAGTSIESANGAISITGTAGGPGGYGILLFGGPDVISTGAATITLNGTGGGGVAADNNYGIYIHSAGTSIQSANGAISITGTGGAGTGNTNHGVILIADADVISTGAATITLNGTGGAGTGSNYGIHLNGVGTSIQSANGAISLTGTGTGTDSYGILLQNSSGVLSSGSAPITLAGSGAGVSAGILSSGAGGPNLIGGASSTGDITLTAHTASGTDSISFSNQTISGTGNLYLQPLNAATTSGIAGGAGIFNLSAADLNVISNGFARITIGRADGTGLITFGDGAGGGAGYTFNDNLTLRNPGAGSNGISINDLLAMGANSLTLSTTGAVTQTAAITAAGLELIGTGGTHTLTNISNAITTLAGNTGTVSYTQAGSLIIGTVNTAGLTASDTILVRSTGAAANITLNNAVTANGAGDALVLAAGQNFTNNVGTTALSAASGRWLVYSTSPAGSTEGGLTAVAAVGSTLPRLYGKTYAANAPATISAGSHLIYSTQPTLTVTAGNQTRLYGDANAPFTSTNSGFVVDDGVTDTATTAGLSGTAALTSLATAASPVSGPTFAITAAAGTLTSGANYAFSFAPGTLTINPATLTYTANTASRLYGASNPSFSGTVTGFVNSETLAGATTGTVAFSSAATATSNIGNYAINGSGLTANNGNYIFAQAAGNATALTINPATLTYTANTATRLYGASNPSFSGTVTGFANSETLAGATTGTVAFSSAATATSNIGNYAINGSGLTANNGNYIFAQAAGNATALTINPATLTYTANTASRLYGASNPSFSGTVTGFANSETLAGATTGTAAFSSAATATSNIGTYAINGSGLTANNGNYIFAQAAGNATALTINPATLTYTANTATRLYGASNPSFSGTVTGFVNSETLAGATTGTAAFSSAATATSNIGTYAINGSGLTANNGNYIFAQAAGNATALTINPATLTYTANTATRLYGASNPTFSGTVTGFANSETLAGATTGTVAFSSAATATSNIGTYAINGAGLTANNGNYIFAQAAGNATALTINPATLTYTANTATRLYGASNPTFSGTVTGFANSETLAGATTGTATFSSAATVTSNIGTYALNGSGLTANNGNYIFAQAAGNATALTINPATLTYTANTATRLYGASNPSFSGTVTGFVNSETLAGATTGTVAFSSAATATSNIGNYAINGSGLTANNGNYVFTQAAGNATALTINPATLTYTANTASRLYGVSNPSFSGTVTGFANSETLAGATTGTATFSSAATATSNIGSYAINGSGLTANNGNYIFAQAAGNATALTINPATLTYTANTASRLYGASNPSFSGTVTGFANSETLAGATTGTATFNSAATATSNIGSYAINGSGLTANNGNYIFAQAAGNATALTINPATLTYTANTASRLYGASNPSFSGTVTGFVNSETLVSATTGTATFSSAATATSNIGTYAINGSGLTANNGNYIFAQAAGNATALTINPATLTYTANTATRLYGASNPSFSGTVTGFANSETLAGATTGTVAFSSAATTTSNIGSYAINGSGLTANNGNYIFAQAAGNATALTINPATLTYTANTASRLYGASNPSFSGTVTGFANSETLATATTGTVAFSSAATATSNIGTYAINGSGLTANNGNYIFAQAAGNATALTINPATLTYTANTASRLYGASNPSFSGTVTGFVNSETLAGATTGTVVFSSTATATSNIGTYAINGSGLTANNGNYIFAQAAGNATALTINPATLTYTANTASRLYGASNPSFSGTVTGFVNSETLAGATTGTVAFSSAATATSNIGSYAINGSGLTANNGNYIFAQAAGNATALTINPATLTYTANTASRLYGVSNPSFSGTVTGFANSETLAGATTGTATFSSAATATSNIGTYAINGSGLTANNGNYIFAQAAGNATALTINPATLTYTANTASRLYGASDPSFSGTITGFVNSQTQANATTGTLTFTTPATVSSTVGSYAINGSGLTANNGNYVFTQAAGNATALTINPATSTPTVIVGTTPEPVVTINGQPVLSEELALIQRGDRQVLVLVASPEDNSPPVDERLALTLDEATKLTDITGTSGGSAFDPAGSVNTLNFGTFERVSPSGGVSVGGGGTGPASKPEPGLYRESTVSMGGFNIVYHEAVAEARTQAESNTALGSSYREFSDSENPQVNIVRAKVDRKPSDSTAPRNGSESL